jgi:hypothetical protein
MDNVQIVTVLHPPEFWHVYCLKAYVMSTTRECGTSCQHVRPSFLVPQDRAICICQSPCRQMRDSCLAGVTSAFSLPIPNSLDHPLALSQTLNPADKANSGHTWMQTERDDFLRKAQCSWTVKCDVRVWWAVATLCTRLKLFTSRGIRGNVFSDSSLSPWCVWLFT